MTSTIETASARASANTETLAELLGFNLAAERRRRRVTQEELAACIGTHKATVSRWETGAFLPDAPHLLALRAWHAS